jgi:hypothetical protein
MDAKAVEAAIGKTTKLLKGVEEPWKSLAFPVVFGRTLQGDLEPLEEPARPRGRVPRVPGRRPTRSATLRRLIAEGWFKTQRSLSDIRKELKNAGLPTKSTTLPSLLSPLVLERKLKRRSIQQGKKDFYVYFL